MASINSEGSSQNGTSSFLSEIGKKGKVEVKSIQLAAAAAKKVSRTPYFHIRVLMSLCDRMRKSESEKLISRRRMRNDERSQFRRRPTRINARSRRSAMSSGRFEKRQLLNWLPRVSSRNLFDKSPRSVQV